MTRKFSYLTLSPLDADDKKRFMRFRTEEIINNFKLVMYFWVLIWFIDLTKTLVSPANLTALIGTSLYLTMSIFILIFSKYKKQGFIYLIPVQYIIILIYQHFFLKVKKPDTSDDTWRFTMLKQYHEEEKLDQVLILMNVLIFSPSLAYTILIYTPICVVGRITKFEKYYDLSEQDFDPNFFLITVVIQPTVLFTMLFCLL